MTAWVLFRTPMPLEAGSWMLWLLLPLCMAVAIVYKTVRTKNLRRLPLEVLALMGYMTAGLVALGIGLWLFHTFLT